MLWIDIDIGIYNIDKVSDKKYSVIANIISQEQQQQKQTNKQTNKTKQKDKKHSENADTSTSVTFDLKLWPRS